MSGPWQAGLTVRGLDRGGIPVADLLCTVCWFHRRVTGRARVVAFLASQPIETHRAECPASKETA